MKKKTYVAPALCLVVLHERLMVVGQSDGGSKSFAVGVTNPESPSSSYEDDDDPNASRRWGGIWDDDDY